MTSTAPIKLALARAAFDACVDAKLNPSLQAITAPADGEAEYDIVLGGKGYLGVVHEDLVTLVKIAEDHQGRLWLGQDGELAIVWPLERNLVQGPGEPSEGETQRVAKRGRRKVTA